MEDPFQVVKDEVQRTMSMAIGLYYHWCELSSNSAICNKDELEWTVNELKNNLRSIDWDLEDLDETILIVERYIKKFKISPSELQARRRFIHETRQSVKEMKEHLMNPGLKTLETTALLQESQVIDCLANLDNNNYTNNNNYINNYTNNNNNYTNNNNIPNTNNMILPNNNTNNNLNKIPFHNNNNTFNNNNNTIFTINNPNNSNNNTIFTINNTNTITMPTLSIKPFTNHYTRLNDDDDDDDDEDNDDDGVGGEGMVVPDSPTPQCLCLNMETGNEDTGNHPSSPRHDEQAIMLEHCSTPITHTPSSSLHRAISKLQQLLGLQKGTWKKWTLIIFFIIIIITILAIFLLI